MVEIFWTNIYTDEKIKIFHCVFKKMEVVKLYTYDNEKWKFDGCYILNLMFEVNEDIAKFHFYTINYYLADSIKRICIQPLLTLSADHLKDNDDDINNRIITWYKNCQQLFLNGIDVLGQYHGDDIWEDYARLQQGQNWDNNKMSKDYAKNKIIKNFDNIYNAVLIAEKLKKNSVIEILLGSQKITINQIFS